MLGLALSVFLLGASAFGGDAIETKPGDLPVAKEQGDLTDLAMHLNNPVGPVWHIVTQNWIGGVFVQNWWSLAGHNAKPVVSQMNLQYFLYRMLPDAWQVGFAPMSW